MYRYPELVEQNRTARLAAIIRSGFSGYVGRTGYEELARMAVTQASDNGQLPFEPLYIGRAWNRRVEIDVVAISHKENAVLLGGCKWHRTKMGPDVLANLRERSEQLKHIGGFKKHYTLFSRSGFTKRLQSQALEEGVILFDGPDFKRIAP